MHENTIFVNRYEKDENKFPINRREIWRYSGYKGQKEDMDEELQKLLEQVIAELEDAFSFKVCYRRMKLSWQNGMPLLPFHSESKGLAQCLKGSSEVIIFAATIGIEIDRYIARHQRFSPTKALLAQAYGAERVECLCDVFCREIKEMVVQEGFACTPRFSPGYGDLPLVTQVELFQLLDCNRQIGISLNESLLMTPSKSVTAIFGVGSCVGMHKEKQANAQMTDEEKSVHKCEACENLNCEYRI